VTLRLNVTTRSGKVRVRAGDLDFVVEGGVVTEREDGIEIRRDRGAKVIDIQCPRGTDLTVGTLSGNIRLEGPLGTVRVASASGKVTVEDTEKLDVRSKSGNVDIGRCAGECRVVVTSAKLQIGEAGWALVAGVSGDIEADAVGRADVKTVSGKVELGTTGASDVRVKTVSGTVEIRVPPNAQPSTRLKSISGKIKNDCLAGGDGEISVASVSGTIRVCCE
jgi:DUF4097 and DUF4098 domain-containing protein YvlB